MGIFENFADIDVTVLGDAAIESEITMLAICENSASDEEASTILNNLATEMALFNVIDNAEAAIEASQKIVIKNAKQANFNKVQARTALRLAQADNSPLYKKYAKGRAMMLEAREDIMKKYGNKAKSETRTILSNSKRKAASMSSGKSITNKIDAEIAKVTK